MLCPQGKIIARRAHFRPTPSAACRPVQGPRYRPGKMHRGPPICVDSGPAISHSFRAVGRTLAGPDKLRTEPDIADRSDQRGSTFCCRRGLRGSSFGRLVTERCFDGKTLPAQSSRQCFSFSAPPGEKRRRADGLIQIAIHGSGGPAPPPGAMKHVWDASRNRDRRAGPGPAAHQSTMRRIRDTRQPGDRIDSEFTGPCSRQAIARHGINLSEG